MIERPKSRQRSTVPSKEGISRSVGMPICFDIFFLPNTFVMGLGPLDQDFTFLLILQENGEELNELAIPNEINTINVS